MPYMLIELREWNGRRKFGTQSDHATFDDAKNQMHRNVLSTGVDNDRRGWVILNGYGETNLYTADGAFHDAHAPKVL
jgi:hypothetical protein